MADEFILGNSYDHWRKVRIGTWFAAFLGFGYNYLCQHNSMLAASE